MLSESDDARRDNDAIDTAVVDDHLFDGVAIIGNGDVAFAAGGAQNVSATRLELPGHGATEASGCAGDEKQLAAEIHAAMLTHKCAGRTTERRYVGW